MRDIHVERNWWLQTFPGTGFKVKGARSCVGGSCAAVAMGVNQANYSTYIQIEQLYITIMQTAVFTKKIVSIPQTLFKI